MADETFQDKGRAPAHRATQRVLAVFDLLAQHPQGLTFSEICRDLGVPKGSFQPIIKTMCDERFIEIDEATGRYTVGVKLYATGRAYRAENSILRLLESTARSIVDAVGETCQVGTRDHDRVMYLTRIDSPEAIFLTSAPGKTLPLYSTAIGKALLSGLDERDMLSMLPAAFEPYTPHTLAGPSELLPELEAVRATGLAYDNEETTEGVTCIAAPLRLDGRIVYGLGVTTPTFRLTPEKRLVIEGALTLAAARFDSLVG